MDLIRQFVIGSADAADLNSKIVNVSPEQSKVQHKRRKKKSDPKKELKIMMDRYIINLNIKDKDDLEDFIAFLTCYMGDDFDREYYFNSTLVLIMRKLIEFEYYIDTDSIVTLMERVSANDKIKANTISEYIAYLDKNSSRILSENMNLSIVVIHSSIIGNNLWISEETYVMFISLMLKFIDMKLYKDNMIIVTILTCVNEIIVRYPYFENKAVRSIIDGLVAKCYGLGLIGLDCNYDEMSSKLIGILYDNVVAKPYRRSGIDSLGSYQTFVDDMKNDGKNLIIDGKNIFHDTSGKEKKYINIKGLRKFIMNEKEKKYTDHEYKSIYVVFYCEHYKVLEEHLKDLIERKNHNSIEFCAHLHILLSPMKQNDDVLTLHLWLSGMNNYILTKDNFTDHAKSFHSDCYLYENWNYYYTSKTVSKY